MERPPDSSLPSPLPTPSAPSSLASSAAYAPASRVQTTQHQQQQHRPAPSSFAFLVHSQHTIPHNLPPSVDNKSLARQRRRRTSPEDQAILEAEFQRDSKPDTDERRRIVGRVALGEKEVQIWFQNRRQNKRRRAQPPQSYEILPRLEPAPDNEILSSPADDGISDVSLSQGGSSSSSGVDTEAHPAISASSSTLSDKSTIDKVAASVGNNSIQIATPLPQPSASFPGPSIPSLKTQNTSPKTTQATPWDTTTLMIASASSSFRLSMTSSGGAKIISGTDPTPSPPRSQPLAPTPFATRQTLRRSYSAAGLRDASCPNRGDGFSPSLLGLGRGPSGRSRDSRAWEFWCDSEARNGLVRKAAQDTSGSAADAISLIRSGSEQLRRRRSGVLTPNLGRTNLAMMMRGESETKRVKTGHRDGSHGKLGVGSNAVGKGNSNGKGKDRDKGKGKADKTTLKRATSSRARLQSSHGKETYPADESESPSLSPRGDSDKENREPGASGLANAGRQQKQPERLEAGNKRRAVLGESRTVPAAGSKAHRVGGLGLGSESGSGTAAGMARAGRHANYASLGPKYRPNEDEDEDEEVAAFMRGDKGSGSVSRRIRVDAAEEEEEEGDDEMDCVAGLLSLSRGNWR